MNTVLIATFLHLATTCADCSGWSDTDYAGAGYQHGRIYTELSTWQESYEGEWYTGQEAVISVDTDIDITLISSHAFGDYEQTTFKIIWSF